MLSSCKRAGLLLACCILTACATTAESDTVYVPTVKPDLPKRSLQYLDPPELQFSCAVTGDPDEDKLAELLAKGQPYQRLAAAKELWERHSRRQARNVIKYVSGAQPDGEDFQRLKRDVDDALKPQAILRELQDGDYVWGAWLAFLRPHEELVPTLVAGLKSKPSRNPAASEKRKPEFLPETMLALGNSRDARALEPLSELLKSRDGRIAGDAANALGYLGKAEAEPKLIEALAWDNGWRQVNACWALGVLGSRKALPELEKLAKDNRYTGALNVNGAAEHAIERITKREAR